MSLNKTAVDTSSTKPHPFRQFVIKPCSFIATGFFSLGAVQAQTHAEQEWGIAAMSRIASIPFNTAVGDSHVATFVPMMYFQNETLFIDGLEGGVYLYNPTDSVFKISALTRLRFVDIPKSIQNSIEGDSADFGVQVRYQYDDVWHFDAEIMSDDQFHFHGNIRATAEYEIGDLALSSSVNIRYKEADFNSTYYSFEQLGGESIGAGVDLKVGIDARYHVISNFYLLGSTSMTRLDNNAYYSSAVNDRYQGEISVGFGFFNDKTKPLKQALTNKRYLRLAHGWATPANIGEIINFEGEKDPYNNQLSSVFYGHPLTDEVFGFPVDLYFTSGIAHHWSSSVQSASTEWIAAIKAYYTFNWPTTWRLGFAEGMSYVDNITYIEQTEMDEKGYTPSHLLNYLDFSVDVNVGDLMNRRDFKYVWVGYSLHHRSAIFEKSSQYGRIKGGSNYNTVYLQFDF
ncbi:MipA/OmpV family protein [Vibrio cincinnatiensis]|uniref:MipA/OmpV family protein n=1 Tax=Vibrio cincinnatiensis TaxID=675 RepID=UPI001EE04294|nr:MipA/OmpV family protein [Vibrio cincinnatiensis]MCG3765054.1 MipA/OmpV family protein [Vibrio cincinnatiensis]